MTNEELLEVIDKLLRPLDDGHVLLAVDDDLCDGDDICNFEDYRGAERVIYENIPLQTDYDDLEEYTNAIVTNYKAIRASYLDSGSMNSVDGAESGQFLWGTIGGVVGYLRVASMTGLSEDEFDAESDLPATKEIMTSILTDLKNTHAMIVDVRVNDGGEDAVGLTIAGFFTDQKRLAVSKFARPASGPTELVDAYIKPLNDTPYLNPVAVIGAPDTASAAEIFLMAMSLLPQTTLVGENSNGILSDILPKTLPNGWEVGLSNEVYLDANGVSHEVTGVPPAVTAPTFSLQAIEEGRDAAIDSALETLGYAELSRH
ncbi:MAG: S41 family peptidase [Candidatus Thiodiazotropha sp.]